MTQISHAWIDDALDHALAGTGDRDVQEAIGAALSRRHVVALIAGLTSAVPTALES